MKVFLSHSGAASRLVAKSLNDWLQRIIQAVKPFYSPEIDKGANWSNKVDEALEGTQFGIICLTPDNLSSEWIHYESGALSKTKDASICTFLLDIKPSDVKQPLGKFQHTLAEKSDVLKMLKSINAKVAESGENSLTEKLLEEIFMETWNKLEKLLDEAKKEIKTSSNNENDKPNENIRNNDDKLDEILEILRSSQREDFPKKNSIPMEDTIVGKTLISRGYKSMMFFLSKEKPKYTDKQIKELIIHCFPNSEVAVNTGVDNTGFFVNISFKSKRDISTIAQAVKSLQTKTEYKVQFATLVRSEDNTSESFEL